MLHAAPKKHSHHLRAILNIECQGRFISSWGLERSQFTALKLCSLQVTIRGYILEDDGLQPDTKKLWLSNLNQGDTKQEDWRGGVKAHHGNYFKKHNIAVACQKTEIAVARAAFMCHKRWSGSFVSFYRNAYNSGQKMVTHKEKD